MIKHLLPLFFLLGLFTTPLQAQWTDQESYISTRIWAVKAVDENVVWAASENGVFLRTTDGGETWIPSVIPGADTVVFYSIAAIDANTAYYAGATFEGTGTSLYKTTDGGETWTLQFHDVDLEINSVAFWDESNGIIVSSRFSDGVAVVHTTSDGGANWNKTPEENIPSMNPNEFPGFIDGGGTTLAVAGDSHAWFGTAYNAFGDNPIRVFRSTDKGQTWTAVSTPQVTDGQYYGTGALVFIDTLNGYSSSGGTGPSTMNRMAHTTDGGLTWTIINSFPAKPLGLAAVPGTDGQALVANSFAGSFYSIDGGENWTNLSSDIFIGVSFASPTVGWTGFFNGRLVKYNGPPLEPTSSIEQEPETLAPVRLLQNHPNPFREVTTIRFSLVRPAPVRLEVVDMTGQVVSVPVENTLPAGEHQVEFAAGELPAGVYLCRLQAGVYTTTQKMTVLK